MTDYNPPSLLFVTSTRDGIIANMVVDGSLTRIPLTQQHALCLLVQLAHCLEFDLAHNRNG